jgi:serine/threonine-protein kinase
MLRKSILAAALLYSATAGAQGSSDQAAAEALFEAGKSLLAEGKTSQACPKLEESLRIESTGPTLFLLASCLEKDSRYASAWIRWKEAAELARKRGKSDKEQEALSHLKVVTPLVPKVRINVDTAMAATTGLEVKRNGVVINAGMWGVDLPVDPGEISVEASAPGKTPWKEKRALTPGKVLTFDVPSLKDLPASAAPAPTTTSAPAPTPPPPAAPTDSEDPGATRRLVGYTLGGLGVVGVGIGAIFIASAISKQNKITDLNDQHQCDLDGCADLVSQRNGKTTISYIGFIGGGAALVGGLVLVLTAPNKATYTVAPTAQGLLLRGTF